jgi:O-antigen/teichoic acid export membrane protein
MVVAHIASGVLFAALLWWAARGRLRLERTPGSTRGLLATTLPLAVMAILELIVYRLDPFVLGLRFESEVVAFAGLATYAAYFFSRHLADPVGRALLPGMVRFRADPAQAFDAFRLATFLLTSFIVPTAFFLFVNAELAALFLGGEEWVESATYLRIISLVPLVRPLAMFGPDYLLTRHQDRLLIVYTAVNLASLGGLGLILTRTALGPIGMAVASYFPLGLVIVAWALHRADPVGLRRLARESFELYAAGALLFGPVLLVAADHPWWRFGLSCLAGAALLGYTWRRFGEDYRRFMRSA